MHYFIPYFDAASANNALQEARRLVWPGDRVTVMAPVVVPGNLPVDVGAGALWKRTCAAERHLCEAREDAERLLPASVNVRVVRVQARDRASAILAGAAHIEADLILLPMRDGLRGAIGLRFGTIAEVLRYAPCNVRLVGTAERGIQHRQAAARPDAADTVRLSPMLRVITDGPPRVGTDRDGTPEGQKSSTRSATSITAS
jgi:hypothetical protein